MPATAPRRSLRLALLLGASTALTVGALHWLTAAGVPLGERDAFEYRVSPFWGYRLGQIAWLVPVLVLTAWALKWLGGPPRGRRAGEAAGVLVLAALCVWTWAAPPRQVVQHAFNLLSPSHDGAFVGEAMNARVTRTPMSTYLRGFDRNLRLTPEQKGGTRVLSNPPGMTLLADASIDAFGDVRQHNPLEQFLLEQGELGGGDPAPMAVALRFSMGLTACWFLSGLFAYALGRWFLSPLGAGLLALVVTFNPMTVHFVPGKDPAQLLTINAMLLAWFAGTLPRKWRGGGGLPPPQPLACAMAGAVLLIGATSGLIHIWVALAAALATAWLHRGALWAYVLRGVLPAAGGAVACAAAIYLAVGWNAPATLWAVAVRFGEIQEWIRYDRSLWVVIGLPLFVLFLPPVIPALALLPRRRWRPRSVGFVLLLSTLAVMLLTYAVGVTYELPRLWVAFVPLLALGAFADVPFLRVDRPHRRAYVAAAVVAVVAIATTALHWAPLDARESELRLTAGRYFD